jgi:GAF domain-containing protein
VFVSVSWLDSTFPTFAIFVTSLVNYVWRTAETLVINDATKEANWPAEPYIIQHHPKSLLCLQIQHQGI